MRALQVPEIFPLINLHLLIGATESRAGSRGQNPRERRCVSVLSHGMILLPIPNRPQG